MKKSIFAKLVSFIMVFAMVLGVGALAGEMTVKAAEPFSAVPMVAAGNVYTAALRKDGTVWAWGSNYYGQLGDGTTTDRTAPVQVTGLTGITAIAAGRDHTVALKSDGTVCAWGYNYDGQLGDGSTILQRNISVPVTGLSGVTAIAAGAKHTVALRSDGTVWAWGDNYYGQLGDGTTTDHGSPVPVSGLSSVAAIAAGVSHTVALGKDGTVWAWGDNIYAQLGNGTTTGSIAPIPVTGVADITAIAAGGSHTVALKSDGTIWAWGENEYGQLGDDTTTDGITPRLVTGVADITAIAAGSNHTVALKPDGTVWEWGHNFYGQLGDGTTTNRTAPVQITRLTGITAIAAGNAHTIALRKDGMVWAWGLNESGQLGDGTNTRSTTPVQVLGKNGTGFLNLNEIPLQSISLNKSATILKKGKSETLQVTYNPTNTTASKTITWSTSNSKAATVDKNGKVTAVNPGTATITAKVGSKTATCTVKVEASKIAVTGVKITNAPANMIKGQKSTLNATISPSNATSKTVTWSTSDRKVAEVDQSGKVTAKGPGKVSITATAKDGSKVSRSVGIAVHSYVSMRVGKSTAIMNGKKTTIDKDGTKPFKLSGKTMLPLRFVGEKMGGTVKYVNDKKPITMTYGNKKVEFTLNSQKMTVYTNGKKSAVVTLAVAAQKKNGRTYIPLRAISQALGFDVYYQSGTEYIIVNNPKMTSSIRNQRLSEAKKLIK